MFVCFCNLGRDLEIGELVKAELTPKSPEPRSLSPPAPHALTSADPHAPTEQAKHLEHGLFDPQLLNIKLKVKFMEGEHENKKAVTAPSIFDGWPVLPFLFYKTQINYPPQWVSIVHPNPMRDEGLLVVIRGEHW